MESNDVQINTSQTIAEWKAQNAPRLDEIKNFNPDLYTAINGALSYLNKKYGGEEIIEETIVEPIVEPIVVQEELEGESPLETMERILYFGNNEVEISDQDIRKALFSKRKSKQQKLIILKAFGDVVGVDLKDMYGDIFRNAFLQEYENEVGQKQYFRGYRPNQLLKDWDDDLELAIGQNTDLNEEQWIDELIYPEFENQINMKDEANLEDMYSLWLTIKNKTAVKVTPNIPQESISATQTFVEGDYLIDKTGEINLDEDGNPLEFNRVLLTNVVKVTDRIKGLYYNFDLQSNLYFNNVNDGKFEKLTSNPSFLLFDVVFDTRTNIDGIVIANLWDNVNNQFVYLVEFDGVQEFVEEKYLSYKPVAIINAPTLNTPPTTASVQSSSTNDSKEDEEDLGNLLDDLDNFEI